MTSPTHINQEAIEAFKAAYEAEFHEKLSDEEIRLIALDLLRFFQIIRKVE